MTLELKSPRPRSLSIIGWWLVVSAVMSVCSLSAAASPAVHSAWADMGISPTAGILVGLVSGAANAAAGLGILMGQSWGRAVYLVAGLAGLIVSWLTFHTPMAFLSFGIVVFAAFAYLLSRPAANDYFAGVYELDPADRERRQVLATLRAGQYNKSETQRIFGVLFSVAAGFLLLMAFMAVGFSAGGVALLMAVFFGLPGLIALIVGVLLWGWSRWEAVAGWTLSGTGGGLLLMGVSLLVMMKTSYWETAMADAGVEDVIPPDAFAAVTVVSLPVLLAGAGLLYYRYRKDFAEAEAIMKSSRPE